MSQWSKSNKFHSTLLNLFLTLYKCLIETFPCYYHRYADVCLGDYSNKFVETAGTTVLSSSNTIYQEILDTNQCAKLCIDYMGFNCKSFDYCPDIGTCYLGRSHVYDVPKAQIQSNPMCNHWSSKFSNKLIPLCD